jgi:hypothetical protein
MIPDAPSLLPSRPAVYAPMTSRDEEVLAVAQWLDNEGYTPAAAVLRAVVGRHQIVTLDELRQGEEGAMVLDRLKGQVDLQCRIYSDQHRLYWRSGARGYTGSALEAGLYTFWAAYAATAHCGPEKAIAFEILPTSAARPERTSGWKS